MTSLKLVNSMAEYDNPLTCGTKGCRSDTFLQLHILAKQMQRPPKTRDLAKWCLKGKAISHSKPVDDPNFCKEKFFK